MSDLVTFDFSTFTATDIAQIAGAVGTFAIAVITFAYVLATRAMVREMRTAREAQQRPYVVLDIDFPRGHLCDMIIRNVGNGAAVDLTVSFQPDEEYQNSGMKLSELPIFKETRFLVPGREIRFYYKNLVGEAPPTDQQAIKATLHYRNTRGADYTDEITLNPYLRWQLYYLEEKTFNDLVKELEQVNRSLKRLDQSTRDAESESRRRWLASLPTPTSSDAGTVKAKLREIHTLWQGIYGVEGDEYRNPWYIQPRLQRHALELVMIYSLATTSGERPSPKLARAVPQIARELYALGSQQFYMDGGESRNKFDARGRALMTRIDDLLAHD